MKNSSFAVATLLVAGMASMAFADDAGLAARSAPGVNSVRNDIEIVCV